MITKAFDECRDCFIVGDFWNLKMHIREMSDVVTQWFVLAIPYSLKIILVARLLVGAYEVVNGCLA